jgi:hypothetical protein
MNIMRNYLNLKLQETIDNYEMMFDSQEHQTVIQPDKIFADLFAFYS